MKKTGRIRNILLISFAVIFVAAAGIGEASAYFTTYARAKGAHTIDLGYRTRIEEEFDSWTKRVTIENTKGSPVYIRARAYSGDQYELTYSSDGGWEMGTDGWYYYTQPVEVDNSTSVLNVLISGIPQEAVDGDEFNIVVVYESTPVRYDENGDPYPYYHEKIDWTAALDTGKWEGGSE